MSTRVERSLAQGFTLAHWSNNLRLLGHSELAEQLRVTPDPYASAKEKGLPVPPYLFFTSPNTFLNNPEQFFRKLKDQEVTNFFANLRPKRIGLDKHRQLNLSPDRLITYVKGKLKIVDPNQYNLLIAEYRPALFGGTMIINPNSEFVMELVKGETGNLAIGHANPEYTVVWRPDAEPRRFQPFEYSASFNREDSRLKTCVEDILIPRLVVPTPPKDTEIALREVHFRPEDAGYYEYSFLPSHEGVDKPWDIVFFDYNNNPAFYLPRIATGLEAIKELKKI